MLFLGGNEHSVKVSSNSEMVRAGVLFENFGDYRELILKLSGNFCQSLTDEQVCHSIFRLLCCVLLFLRFIQGKLIIIYKLFFFCYRKQQKLFREIYAKMVAG